MNCSSPANYEFRLHVPHLQTKAHLDVLADALLRWARGR